MALGNPLPWGKYMGVPLDRIPVEYLRWVVRQTWIGIDIYRDVEAELKRRIEERRAEKPREQGSGRS